MPNKLVLEALTEWVSSQPGQKVWTFLDDKGEVSDSFTYQELDRASSALAAYLLNSCHLQKGDRALLVFFPGLHFTAALIACFKAGIIAVPVFPPDPRRLAKDLHHFVSIQSSSGATIALTHNIYNFAKKVSDIQSFFSTKGQRWPDLRWIAVDDILSKGKSKPVTGSTSVGPSLPDPPVAGDIAFLQYTSGSTSEPKGVMISHGNLAHNLTCIVRELGADTDTVNVSWLPQYHDMGLIGSYLGALYCGAVGYYISPISFLKDPTIWLRTVSKYKGTHSQAPNFAFALATRKYKESLAAQNPTSGSSPALDLSSVKHMINAAEPVDHVAIAQFYATFKPYGLPTGVVIPTYGLAEHTVFVCSGGAHVLTLDKSALEAQRVEVISEHRLDETQQVLEAQKSGKAPSGAADSTVADSAATQTQTIVGCGYPFRGEGVTLIIVDQETQEIVGSDKIGEIWVTSTSKAQGYWNQPELSEHDFHAVPKTPSSTATTAAAAAAAVGVSGGYLRTGDLGFLHSDELFICGRCKDLIIVRGSNHYPQDIERTAEKGEPLLRAGCSAAFAVKHVAGHTEAVVYVAEVVESAQNQPAKLAEIVRNCRELISTEHGVSLSSVVLLKTRTVPKTTSGKIARAWCRKAYLEGKLAVLYRWDGTPNDSDEISAEKTGIEGSRATVNAAAAAAGTGGPTGGGDTSVGAHNLSVTNATQVELQGLHSNSSSLPKDSSAVRSLTHAEILSQLEAQLIAIASQGAAPVQGPINQNAPIITLGLDSMTIVQFKGLMEKSFFVDIPDDFLFTQYATLYELAHSVKAGGLTSQQKANLENAKSGNPAPGGGSSGGANGVQANAPSTQMIAPKQPLCPWFTCCY